MKKIFTWLFALLLTASFAQTNSYEFTKAQHQKEIIGYFTQWDAWKSTSHGVEKGFYNQLNLDYSQYTILNWSFFGVANDGSLHSGDYRNSQIHEEGVEQESAPIFNTDSYSSWDNWLFYGEMEILYYLPDDLDEKPTDPLYWVYEKHGYKGVDAGANWVNVITGATGSMSEGLAIPSQNGAKGILELAHQNDVKVMASLGGWSMSKHFPEVAADPVKRARFIEDCVTLITTYGFDGIDIDWEFPGPFSGMNFIGTSDDYENFEVLMEELREAIGGEKLITAAFNASPGKLAGFDWASLSENMDYFNMMSYDMNGGWSDHAGHNSPLYSYDNADGNTMSWDETFNYLVDRGVSPEKINMGVGFYGRGVITQTEGALNAPTIKVQKNIVPDGLVSTASDYSNWGAYDGAPNYTFIKDNQDEWETHWDDIAKVPYLTKGNSFLSYDNVESIEEKAKYINTNNIGGVIVWQVFGDLDPGEITETYSNKLPYSPTTKAPLVNTINRVFTENSTIVDVNKAPSISFGSINQNQEIFQHSLSEIVIDLSIVDVDGTLETVAFILNGQTVDYTQNDSEFSIAFIPSSYGAVTLNVTAMDNLGEIASKTLNFEVKEQLNLSGHPVSSIISTEDWDSLFPYRIGRDLNGNPIEGEDDYYSYDNFIQAINAMNEIEIIFERRCGTNAYRLTRINKVTGESLVIREDLEFTTSTKAIIVETKDYGLFANEGDTDIQLRELAAYLANIAQETTGGWDTAPGGRYSWGLRFNEEVGYSNGSLGYRDEGNLNYAAVEGKSYHGRGPIQLSWNYNYGQVSEFLFGDKNVLLDNPNLVVENGVVGFQTALWFWMTEQYPKPSAHDVMTGKWIPTVEQQNNGLIAGFGATVNIINGGIECNTGGAEFTKVTHRIGHYEKFTSLFNVSTGIDGSNNSIDLGCSNMGAFQIDTQECEEQDLVSIAFAKPLNNETIAMSLGDSIDVLLNISDPNNELTNTSISIEGNIYTGSQIMWTPLEFGSVTITGTSSYYDEVITTSITVNIIDENTVSTCDLIDAWDEITVYAEAGNKISYKGAIYQNKWWTQNDVPGNTDVWEFIEVCEGIDDDNSDDGTNDEPLVGCDLAVSWSETEVYAEAGNQILYDGKIYQNKWWTQSDVPGENAVWEFLENCEDDIDADDDLSTCEKVEVWELEKEYDGTGKQVLYEGKIYQNKWWTQSDLPGESDVWEFVENCDNVSAKISYRDADTYIIEKSIEELKVFPSITSNIIHIESEKEINTIELYSFQGELQFSTEAVESIDVSHVRSGNYLLRIVFKDNTYETIQIIKID